MLDQTHIKAVTDRYLGDIDHKIGLPIIELLEQRGYELAREGKSRDAQTLFILIAGLTNALEN